MFDTEGSPVSPLHVKKLKIVIPKCLQGGEELAEKIWRDSLINPIFISR